MYPGGFSAHADFVEGLRLNLIPSTLPMHLQNFPISFVLTTIPPTMDIT